MARFERTRAWIPAIVTFCLVYLPMQRYYEQFRTGAALYFFAGDSFYYFDIARNFQRFGFFTFDGVHPTNGFHPLWQYLLAWLARLPQFSLAAREPLAHIFRLDLLLVATGYALFAFFAAKQLREFWLIPLALCPGFTWLLTSIIDTNYLSAWSWVNGMECGLSLLCFGIVLLFFDRNMPSGWRLWLGALFFGFAVLARLDDVFFLLVFVAYAIWNAPGKRTRAALPFVLPFSMIAAYLLYNHRTVGAFFPVSGATKASCALWTNLRFGIIVLQPSSWDPQPFPAAPVFPYSNWSEMTMRLAQLWLPILLCGAYLALGYTRRTLGERPVLSCLCAGALAKGLYNLAFVSVTAQGHWYYPVSLITCNVMLAVLLDQLLARVRGTRNLGNSMLRYVALLSAAALFAWISFFGLVAHKAGEQFARDTDRMYEHGPQIAQDIRSTGESSYLEMQDGLLSFVSGMPGTSSIGLATDVEAMKAKKEGRYFDLMASRGIHIIVAGGPYIAMFDPAVRAGLDRVDPGELLGSLHPSEYTRYSIVPELHDEDADITIYRIVKKEPANR